jgi:hypothetical protein
MKRNESEISRRDFIRQVAAVTALSQAAFGGEVRAAEAAQSGFGAAKERDQTEQAKGPRDTFVGIQMGPHSLFDEGIEPCLDFIQQTAAVNAVLVYSQSYFADGHRPTETLAQDHGLPFKELNGRKLPFIWVRPRDSYYTNTVLRYRKPPSGTEFADRDLFAELLQPVRARGMKLYARILETSGRFVSDAVENFDKALAVDVYGQPMEMGCWNNPDYRNFWAATSEDLFRSYELDGLQWGAERHGPLMTTLLNGTPPFCFCQHCQSRCRAQGINVERAKKGFTELHASVQALLKASEASGGAAMNSPGAGQMIPASPFTGLLRVLLRYPEVLAWEYQYRLSREETEQAIYSAAKKSKPGAQVGWHVDHQQSSWDQIYRAELTYGEMAGYSDFIKPIVYHDILGPRIRWWYLERLKKTVLTEIPLEESLDLYYDTFGYDKTKEPSLEKLDQTGFSPDYVYRETRRTVIETGGKAKVYAGVGFDIPWNGKHFPSDAEKVYRATRGAFDANADGIVISREYDEMRRANLEAAGRAVREEVRKRAAQVKSASTSSEPGPAQGPADGTGAARLSV